jgi:hypothetical protein
MGNDPSSNGVEAARKKAMQPLQQRRPSHDGREGRPKRNSRNDAGGPHVGRVAEQLLSLVPAGHLSDPAAPIHRHCAIQWQEASSLSNCAFVQRTETSSLGAMDGGRSSPSSFSTSENSQQPALPILDIKEN